MNESDGVRFVEACRDRVKENGMLILGTPDWYVRDYENEFSKVAHKKMYKQEELFDLFDGNFGRVLSFCVNDEIVHTGHPKVAWYYFMTGFIPQKS